MKDHVFNLGNQLKTELELSSDFNFPIYNELLVVGMGGSGVAGDVLKNIIVENSNKKVEVRKTYQLPKIHNPSNLFLLFISYSGNTEETISAAEEAIKLNLNWGAIASGGLLAYDVGEAIFSKGARAEYTLANPAASEEDRMEAMDYLIKEDPTRLGVEGLEDVSPEQRMSFLAAQDENPELTSEQFNTQMIEEQGGPTDKQLADLQTRVTDQTSGFFNRKGNDLEEAQAMIKSSGMEGKVIAKETNNGIELERVTEDTTKTEQAAQQAPVIVNAPQQGPMSQPDIVVTLPKTILSQNPSARKFIASTF